jgi:hypothetical protein
MSDLYSKKDLINIIENYNKQFGTRIKSNKTKKEMYNELKKHFSCKLDKCVVKRSKKINHVLKPFGPEQGEWLSNFDILSVMQEYEKFYDNFEFLGCVPIDFNEIDKSFSNFNLKKFNKTKNIFGAIFNTDPSFKSGQHWVSLVVNISKKTICFFDSVGTEPPKEIKIFIDKIVKQGEKNNINFQLFINRKRHQMGNSACGIYSLYFIIKQLQGNTCQSINNNIIKDKEMEKNLSVYFN